MISREPRRFSVRKIFMLGAILAFGGQALASPEFALRLGVNRCNTCHYSPAGGGPKTLDGKYYGANGLKLSPFSAQSYAGADVKFLYFSPDRHTEARGGLAAMAANLWAAIPLTEVPASPYNSRFVGEQNIGGFQVSGPRNLYLEFYPADAQTRSWLPQHIMFGRFFPAFGIGSDEHRTYVRMQTATTWSMGMGMGLNLAADPYEWLHYDLALLNGQENQGQALSAGESTMWGGMANLRWMPSSQPWMLGASANYFAAAPGPGQEPRSAQALYAGLSFHRLTKERFSATLLVEYSQAKNWNVNSFVSTFVSDSAYATQVEHEHSEGWLAQLNYDLGPRWVLTYKYDRILLDRDFKGDAYQRHGVGFKHLIGPNMWVMMRYENALAGRATEATGSKTGGLDAFWAILSVAI